MFSPLRISLLAVLAVSPALSKGCQSCVMPSFTGDGWSSPTTNVIAGPSGKCMTLQAHCVPSGTTHGIKVNDVVIGAPWLKLMCTDQGTWVREGDAEQKAVTTAMCDAESACKTCVATDVKFTTNATTGNHIWSKTEIARPVNVGDCHSMAPVCNVADGKKHGIWLNGMGRVIKGDELKLSCSFAGKWEATVDGVKKPITSAVCGAEIPDCQNCDSNRYPARKGGNGQWEYEEGTDATTGCTTFALKCTNAAPNTAYQITVLKEDRTLVAEKLPVEDKLMLTCKSKTDRKWMATVNGVKKQIRETLCTSNPL